MLIRKLNNANRNGRIPFGLCGWLVMENELNANESDDINLMIDNLRPSPEQDAKAQTSAFLKWRHYSCDLRDPAPGLMH